MPRTRESATLLSVLFSYERIMTSVSFYTRYVAYWTHTSPTTCSHPPELFNPRNDLHTSKRSDVYLNDVCARSSAKTNLRIENGS